METPTAEVDLKAGRPGSGDGGQPLNGTSYGSKEKRYDLHWLRDALKQKPPDRHVIDGMFLEGSLSQVYGDPGTKKTWLMIHAALCVAAGMPWLGRGTLQGTALIIDEESGKRRLERRIEAVSNGIEAPANTPLCYASLSQFNLRDAKDVTSLHKLIVQTKAVFVVIDAMADVMPGADENQVKDVQPFLMNLRKLAEATRAAIVLIHHANKGGDYRGSSAIKGALDMLLKVESKPNSSVIDITSEKARDFEPFTITAEIQFEEKRVSIVSAEKIAKAPKLSISQEYVLRYLRERGPSTVKDITDHADTCSDKAARQAVYHLAEKNMISRVDDGGPGRAATYAVLQMILKPVNGEGCESSD